MSFRLARLGSICARAATMVLQWRKFWVRASNAPIRVP
jgi:hypothetical protein